MATRTTLKSYFETGDKPTQTQFEALIDGVPNLTDSSVTDAEFAQLDGVTSPIQTQIDGKQATLVNQTNIKSVNGETLLGSGDLTVSSSAAWGGITGTLSSQTDLQSALDLKEDVIAAGTTSEYYRGDKTFVALDKTAVGLPNVDNTSDANKPVSTATQTELDEKQDTISLTTTGTSGVATFVGSTLNVPDYGSAASSVAWGDITGTLSNQTDLDTALDLKADLAGATFTGDVTAPDFIGDLNGAVRFTAKNESGATLLKGKVVAIIGVSGTETTVDLADADNASARPAFGLVYADANNNAAVEVVTLGELAGLNTSAFSEGDTLYVSTTAGDVTTTPPTSEAADIQNIGRVIRSHASAGIIRVGGAGRANQTPNLNDGNVFVGNASNQSVARALVIADTTGLQTALDLKANVAAPTFTGDITSNTVNIISNSTAATTLLIGDVTLGDTITEMRLQAYGADLINLQDQEVTLKSDSLKITGSLSTTAPATYLGLLSSTGVVTKRTPAQVLADIGAAPASGGSYLPLAGGAMTGAITTNSTFDGRDVAADGVTADAALPKTGGEMTGAITGNVAITGFRPYLTETAGRSLTVEDSGTFIIANLGTAISFEIPLNSNEAFTLGTEIDFIQKGAGVLRITSVADVFLNGLDSNTVPVTAQWGGVTIKKIAEDEWIAVGKI